jgi:8-oxo-dGTP pyrophosphatase MutT (NUDIX family)
MSDLGTRIEDVAHIVYTCEPMPWRFAEDEAAAIDAHWQKLVARNRHFFNGRVLLMHRFALRDESGGEQNEGRVLEGACLEADYKAFLAWRDFGFPGEAIWNCFAMPALRSADGAFILGEMAPHTANPGRIYFPAGTPDPSDVRDGIVDLEGNILRELEEETGLTAADVTCSPGWTLVFTGARIACMKIVQSPLPAAALIDRIAAFLAQEEHPELTRVVPVFGCGDLDPQHMPDFTLAYLRHVFAAAR